MKAKQLFFFLFFLGYSLLSTAQWLTNGSNIYYSNGNIGMGTSTAPQRLTINGNIMAYQRSGSASTPSHTFLQLVNTGRNGGDHTWTLYTTASNAGSIGIRPNAFEIYEYPSDNPKRRFSILSTQGVACTPILIGSTGSLHIGYGDTQVPSESNKLSVNGTISAKEIKVTTSPGADFVFEEDYMLPTLDEVENHIKENKHLPGIPSAKEMEENGLSINEFQIKLLQKIEELTLYVIELKKENDMIKGKALIVE